MYTWQSNSFFNYSLPSGQMVDNQQYGQSFNQQSYRFPQFCLFDYSYSLPLPNHNFTFSNTNDQAKQTECLNNLVYQKNEVEPESKSKQLNGNKLQKKNGNIKANIIRDFIRHVKKDASIVLLVKKQIKSSYSIKNFMETLLNTFPNQNKYLRFKKVQQLCQDEQEKQFSKLLRIVFLNFIKTDYKCLVLSKKKSKLEYLKSCREMCQNLMRELK